MKLKDIITVFRGGIVVRETSGNQYTIINFNYPSFLLEREIMRVQSEGEDLVIYLK